MPASSFTAELHQSETVKYEIAYAADILRYGIGVSQPFSLNDGPAMWLQNGVIVEAALVLTANPPPGAILARVATRTAQAAGNRAPAGPHSLAHDMVVPGQQPVVFASVSGQPATVPFGHPGDSDARASEATNELGPGQERWWLVRRNHTLAPKDTEGGARHTLEVGLSSQNHKGAWKRETKSKFLGKSNTTYHLLFDTGSKPSWVWGRQNNPNVVGVDRVLRGGTDDEAEAVAQQDIWDKKRTFPYPLNLSAEERTARSGQIRYGVAGMTPSTVSFIQTTAHLHVQPAEGKEIQIKDFPIGVAYAYTAGAMASYVDGILGFGQQGERDVFETAPLDEELTSRSVHIYLVEKEIIEKPEFYVHLMHPLFDAGRSFVTFGSWSHTENPKTSISVSEGGWHSYLKSISFTRFKQDNVTKRLNPVAPKVSIAVNRPVIFDSGTVQSYFPKDTVDKIREKMTELGAEVPGLCPEHLPHVLAVHFTFKDSSDKEVTIFGQAERFLKTHWRSRSTAGTRLRQLPIVQGGTWAILGSNFFYTFVVGFVDGSSPSVNFTTQEWKKAKPGTITVKDEGRQI